MPLCLTFFSRGLNEPVLRNHAHYCQLYGYPHTWIEANHIAHPALRDSYKYSQILRHLRQLAEGDWLFFLDDDSVIFRPIAIDTLLEGRDLIAVNGPPVESVASWPMMNMLMLRNVAANRTHLSALITQSCQVITLQHTRMDEAVILEPAGLLPCTAVLVDMYVNISWRQMNWYAARVFVVHLGAIPASPGDGRAYIDLMLHDLNLQDFLARQINGALMHGTPVLQPAAYPTLSDEPRTSTNPHARIAFVTLYTHHINAYARVSEHNVRRYCERHGYAYHVYRGIPSELDQAVNGTWIKPYVLQRHIADHDWIIWIDADTLFLNQSKPIEPLLEGRELMFAKDIGAWALNAGVLGFRNTPANVDILSRIWDRLNIVPDKSGVYVSQGDQYYINELLTNDGLLGEDSVLENVSINTPPHLFRQDTLHVHFVNLNEPYRSAYMAHVDALSLQPR